MPQLSLFEDVVGEVPATEGIKYAGSKLKLLPYILSSIRSLGADSVMDCFSGTTRVSQALAQIGYRVLANDHAIWSKVFGTSYLKNTQEPNTYSELIAHLNSISPIEGWFTKHYSGIDRSGSAVQEDGKKYPWQRHNAMRLDGIREEIERLDLTETEEAVALTSLILAMDRVDNTVGHYVSYLKNWSPRSFNELKLEVPRLWINERSNSVSQQDVFDFVADARADVAYLDPPYGSNNEKMPPSRVRYLSYYHVWTTICLNDRPDLFGNAGRRLDSSDKKAASIFEEFRQNDGGRYIAVEAIHELLKRVQAEYIVLSYSSGGRATAADLSECIADIGAVVRLEEIDYRKNVMSEMKWTNEWLRDAEEKNREFLFTIKKGG